MTLILARASAEFVLQVTDRLTTYKNEPYDKVANKNILYVASNAVVAIAYTGNAYLDGVPTDHWIVEKLLGTRIDRKSPPTMITFDKTKPQSDIGQAFRILRNELARQKESNLLVLFQGWQWNAKGRLRPLVGQIEKTPPTGAFCIHYEPRYWYLQGACMTIAAPSANIRAEEQNELSDRLRNKSASEAEGLILDRIREIAQCNSWVGPHCISILIPPPSDPNILVRYHAADSLALPEVQKLADDQFLWAYSPWIASARMCLPPAQVTGGGFVVATGSFSIRFSSQTIGDPKWLLAHQGQKRRGWP